MRIPYTIVLKCAELRVSGVLWNLHSPSYKTAPVTSTFRLTSTFQFRANRLQSPTMIYEPSYGKVIC